MAKQKIVIVGGGFGGVKAALELSFDKNFDVTMISDDDYFKYYPALYHTATGGARQVSAISISELLDSHPIKFFKARALHIDRKAKHLVTKGAGTLPYDILIMALGMETNYFGIKGLKEFSYGIKSLDEVEKLKNHLHEQLRDENKPDAHYLIVGGGSTGVELAGVLPRYIRQIMRHHGIKHKSFKVEIIEALPNVMPKMPKDVGRATAKRLRQLGVAVHTNQKVEAETADALTINGAPVASHTVVWTAGVACNSFFADNKFVMTPHQKVEVNQYLQAEPDIYVLGDNADTLYSGVAQTALYDAVYVTNNLRRLVAGKKPKVYQPKLPVYVTPTGPNWASVVWGRAHFYGRLGWWLRQAADLLAYHSYQPWWPASRRWLAMNTLEESCPICGQSQL
ncbi:MAG: FAD-dependent oxidoreductase [Candidatus Saccharibacteria bacterium]